MHDCDNMIFMVKCITGDNMAKNEVRTITLKVSDNTKEKMVEYFADKKRDKTPPYAVFQAKEADTMVTLYENDKDLLEDAVIENKQAIEMTGIYKNILNSISNTYETIASNNLNNAMKFLAGITIVLSIPTMISSFLGMNIPLGSITNDNNAFVIITSISLVISIIIALLLKHKDML